jgi:cation transport protein ChaC
MSRHIDTFIHHPELRGKIIDPMQSYLRNQTTADLAAKMKEMGLPANWWHAEDLRETLRSRSLAEHREKDLWVFGYGSLMWDPGFRFVEVLRAYAPHHERRFILKDTFGGRGTVERPGLMAALDEGNGCDGLLFRIAREHVEEETEVIWRRELSGPAYIATFIETFAASAPIVALTFMADHTAQAIVAGLTRAEQIQMIATGSGFLGSSLDYLRNVDEKLAALGVHDVEVAALLEETKAYLNSGAFER